MITEIVDIEVKPGEEAAFEAAVAQAIPVFRRSKGCRGMELARTIERPSKYRLVGPYFASPPMVEHVSVAVAGF